MSTPIKLKLNSSNEVKLSLKSYGDIDSITEVSLVIESKEYDLKFNGKVVDGEVVMNVPKLQGLLESGDYVASINVVADGDKFFQPYRGKVEFPKVGKVDVAETEVKFKESDIQIEIIQGDATDEEVLDEVLDEDSKPSKIPTATSFSDIFEKK